MPRVADLVKHAKKPGTTWRVFSSRLESRSLPSLARSLHESRRCSSNSLVGIDLFAGAGGMSAGAALAGVDVVAAIEFEPSAATTYAANHPMTHVICTDMRALGSQEVAALKPEFGQLVLFGGPPCQGFSYSNPRHRNSVNPINWLFREFFRYVDILTPEWVIFENVPGLKDTSGGFFLESVKEELLQRAYAFIDGELNSAHFGVPQNRTRYFIIANNTNSAIQFPNRTHVKPVSVGEAIGDLPPLSNGNEISELPYGTNDPSDYARRLRDGSDVCHNNLVTKNRAQVVERYKHIPQGGNWRDIPESLMTNYVDRSRCHTGIYYRLEWSEPSIVIGNYRKNMLIHPLEHRGLSVREAARIQSFADGYVFHGSIGFQQQQVANAVPPILAKAVFGEIAKSALGIASIIPCN